MAPLESEVIYRMQISMLKATGAWIVQNPSVFYKVKQLLLTFLLPVSFVTTLSLNLYYDINDVGKIAQSLYLNLALCTYLFKQMFFLSSPSRAIGMLNLLEKPILKQYLNHKHVKAGIRISNILGNAFKYSCLLSVTALVLVPLLNISAGRYLPFPFPYRLTNPSLHYFVHAFQAAALYVICWNNMCLDLLPCVLLGAASAQFKVLGEKLECVSNSSKYGTLMDKRRAEVSSIKEDEHAFGIFDKTVLNKIKDCVKHHNAIIDYSKAVEKTFSRAFLAQMISSVLLITFTGLNITIIPLASAQFGAVLTYFGAVINETALYCYFGNDVIVQSSRIGNACYFSKWYNCGPSVRKSLFIIMERSKRPVCITASKLVSLSLSTFTGIFRSSYSYFAVLRRVYEKT